MWNNIVIKGTNCLTAWQSSYQIEGIKGGNIMKKNLAFAFVILFICLLAITRPVSAHETITVGDYDVEYGWVNEPAIVGQPNAVVINITPHTASSSASPTAVATGTGESSGSNIDVSAVTIQAMYGGQTKSLALQPLGEDTPGQFIAPMTPMRAGKYTIHLGGNIGSTAFNTDVIPEEVMTADVVQFPAITPQAAGASSSSGGSAGWPGIAGLVLGALGTILGAIALTRKPAKG